MQQIRIRKTRKAKPADESGSDLRTPSGRPLPY